MNPTVVSTAPTRVVFFIPVRWFQRVVAVTAPLLVLLIELPPIDCVEAILVHDQALRPKIRLGAHPLWTKAFTGVDDLRLAAPLAGPPMEGEEKEPGDEEAAGCGGNDSGGYFAVLFVVRGRHA